MMNNKDTKLTFFENIYYWLWCIFPKPARYGNKPAPFLSAFVSALKIFNGMFILIYPSFFFNESLRDDIAQLFRPEFKWIFVVIILSIGFFSTRHDIRHEKNFESIAEKVSNLNSKERKRKIIIFFLYVIATFGLFFLIPNFDENDAKTKDTSGIIIETKTDSISFDFEKHRHKYEQE